MTAKSKVVSNDVFLLGLDELYRKAMKRHERTELLQCAREIAGVLGIGPANVPIEGYYNEHKELTEYFSLTRSIQNALRSRRSEVADLASFQRLDQVWTSPIFGGRGVDPLSRAAQSIAYRDWSVPKLTQAAYEVAVQSSDFSLVALAALSRHSVVLAALRESVVLYAMVSGSAALEKPEYVWEVDPVLEQRAALFVREFNALFGEELPHPGPESARIYYEHSGRAKIIGRCIRVGIDPISRRNYHWAIFYDERDEVVVKDFWHTDLWTTGRFRAEVTDAITSGGKCRPKVIYPWERRGLRRYLAAATNFFSRRH